MIEEGEQSLLQDLEIWRALNRLMTPPRQANGRDNVISL
jgi:hypothetical protein